MSGFVNTVTGKVSSEELGISLMHEHICYGYPGWEGDVSVAPLNKEQIISKSVEVLSYLKKI